jgi:hypothetical protein
LAFTLQTIVGPPPRCTRCDEEITEGAQLTVPWRKGSAYHFECAVDVDAVAAVAAISASDFAFAQRDPVIELARARIEAERDANRLRKGKGKSAAPIEPARDRKGRPRVRVLYIATPGRPGARHPGYLLPWQVDDYTLRSSRHEFVFVAHSRATDARIDPSQPWVAGVYWQRSDGAISPGNAKLVEWKALGLASPVLVVAGNGADDVAHRDKQAERLRALIAKAGFDPDDAPVLSATAINATFREALLLALDEQAAKVATVEKARRTERVTDTIDALVEGERDEAMALALSKAMQGLRSAREAERARILEATERFVLRAPEQASKVIAPILRCNVVFARESLARMIAAQLSGPAKLPARIEDWLRRWRDCDGDPAGLVSALRAAIDAAPTSKRSDELKAMIERLGIALE